MAKVLQPSHSILLRARGNAGFLPFGRVLGTGTGIILVPAVRGNWVFGETEHTLLMLQVPYPGTIDHALFLKDLKKIIVFFITV